MVSVALPVRHLKIVHFIGPANPKRDFVAYIPLLRDHNFHRAKMANAFFFFKYLNSKFG